ncbi:MAG: LysM peptidoglycan-binding domain-containing protein [Sphingobacteriales bacterium]|nr:LysM peptidoglycan-binding domain-containing protein [Sphingobacteriales bacterium]
MNFLQLIRLFIRYFWLLLFSALFTSVLVYFFTRELPGIYVSKAKVYTGIASSGVESKPGFFDIYGQTNAFDNLLSIITSRETLEEVSLRLLAKHLLLDKPDPKFISEKNYEELMKLVPPDVKALAVKTRSSSPPPPTSAKPDTDTNSATPQEEIKQNDNQQNTTVAYHIVQPDETLYSISRKYNLPLVTLMRLNNLSDNNIKPGQKLIVSETAVTEKNTPAPSSAEEDGKIYYITTATESIESIAQKFNISVKDLIIWNSLKDRQIAAGQKLIVGNKNDNAETGSKPSNTAKITIPVDEEVVGQSALEKRLNRDYDTSWQLEQTVRNLYNYKMKNDTNFIYGLLNYDYKHYSIKALSKISVYRLQSSDLIEITYETDDPGVCQYTLIILCKILIKNFKLIKANQSDAVVEYFTEQVRKAQERLQNAEDELLMFNKQHNIINYDEQTKNIAAKKEELESAYQDEKMNMASAQAAIKKLENKISSQARINLSNEEIISKRNELSEITTRIAYLETENDQNNQYSAEIRTLKIRAEKLKAELEKAINNVYSLLNTTEGIPMKDILNQWLENVIRYEESKAKVDAYNSRRIEFERNYETFAPLGAQLKRIEREISVAEQEYLALLSSLNEAKLRQQNIELTSNVKVIDYPYFPLSPKSTKRKFIVGLSFIFVFISLFILLIIIDFFDKKIKTPERVRAYSKLEVAGVYPLFPERKKKIDYPLIKERITDLIIQDINLGKTATGSKKPNITGFFSTKEHEGKSFILRCVGERMNHYGLDVLCLTHQQITSEADIFKTYEPGISYNISQNIEDLIKNNPFSLNHEYLLIEFPALLTHNFPSDLIKNIDQAYYICNARRPWTEADTKSVESLKALLKREPKIILNGSVTESLESILGEVPRKRSKLRKFVKRLLFRKKLTQ